MRSYIRAVFIYSNGLIDYRLALVSHTVALLYPILSVSYAVYSRKFYSQTLLLQGSPHLFHRHEHARRIALKRLESEFHIPVLTSAKINIAPVRHDI